MNLGHLTKWVRLRPAGRISLPMEKFLALFSYNGQVTLQDGLGGLATFLPAFFTAFTAGLPAGLPAGFPADLAAAFLFPSFAG